MCHAPHVMSLTLLQPRFGEQPQRRLRCGHHMQQQLLVTSAAAVYLCRMTRDKLPNDVRRAKHAPHQLLSLHQLPSASARVPSPPQCTQPCAARAHPTHSSHDCSDQHLRPPPHPPFHLQLQRGGTGVQGTGGRWDDDAAASHRWLTPW